MTFRSEFATDAPEVAAEFLADVYLDVEFRLADGGRPFRLAHQRLDVGPFQIDDVEITAIVDSHQEAQEAFFVSRINRGRLSLVEPGVDQRFGPGELVLVGRPETEARTEVEDFRQDVVTLRTAAIREAAGLDPDGAELPTFASIRPVSSGGVRTWERALEFVGQMLLDDPEVVAAPLVIGSADRMLAGLLLATFPNMVTEERPRRDEHDVRAPGTIRRAISFIDSNADLDIGIGAIAAAAHVSRRAVQLAFRRHLNTTPTAYLRRVRLDLANRELLAASDGDGLTVTDVAYRWGFSSPSRFAERYRAAFGLSPSETLHR
jgi:AraC-like DNA-binding protein